jgi:hypothetical protein
VGAFGLFASAGAAATGGAGAEGAAVDAGSSADWQPIKVVRQSSETNLRERRNMGAQTSRQI